MNDIVILGNGPSVELYKPERFPDAIVIGCNFGIIRNQCDFLVFVDCYAAKNLRREAEYEWIVHQARAGVVSLIFGERCIDGLKSIKAWPAAPISIYDHFYDMNIIADTVVYPEFFREDQELFSSGHMAFYWATEKFKDANIHIFGMDSIFTGNSSQTWSQKDLWEKDAPKRPDPKPKISKMRKGKHDYDIVWRPQWEYLFDNQQYSTATVYGYRDNEVEHLKFNERVKYDRNE